MQEYDTFQALVNAEDFDPDNHDDEDFDARLALLGDKEAVTTCLEKYKEFMESEITKVEKDIQKKIREEWTKIQNHTKTSQHSRNRQIVTEVMDTCTNFTLGIEQLFDQMQNELEEN